VVSAFGYFSTINASDMDRALHSNMRILSKKSKSYHRPIKRLSSKVSYLPKS
jgi:hypothetical protein